MRNTSSRGRAMVVTCIGMAASLLATRGAAAQTTNATPTESVATTQPGAKEAYVPAKLWKVPDGNDYTNNASEYSNQRSAESPDIKLFWSKEYGDDPMANPDPKKRFDVKRAMDECERFYNAYVDDLKFVDRGHSLTDKYKLLIFVIGGPGGTASGGGADDKIGVLWTPATRINQAPYGALAHEIGHSFQYLVHADGNSGFSGAPRGTAGTIHEMTSQWMLWQVYPEWMTFENYHLVAFMKATNLAFLHEDNQYHSPYVLEWWSEKHGVAFIGKLWRESQRGEDPVMAYQRLANLNQAQFNDEIFDASRHFITWDLPRIEKVAARYANQHTTALTAAADGWYQIAASQCPQNYGYNGIKLQVPAEGTKVTLDFKGVVGASGFRSIHPEAAGWRYGFVAVKADGSRVYGDMGAKSEGSLEFTVPADTKFLWLVVSGAPAQHFPHVADGKPDNDEQWPYQIKLTGTTLDPSTIQAATQPSQPTTR